MSDWISVDERLPEPGQVVLVWPRDDEHPAAEYEESGDYYTFRIVCCKQRHDGVTHWQPIPAQPEGRP